MPDSTTDGIPAVEALVPPRLEGVKPADAWRKTITSLNVREQGGRVIEGEFLDAGASVSLPAGTLLVSVDKKVTGFAVHYKTNERYAATDATVTVYIADSTEAEGLRPLWDRHFKQSSSAFGATTVKKITALLAAHPPLGGTVEVLVDARRPNFEAGTCRWCGRHVPKNQGQLVGHGDAIQVECHKACYPSSAVTGDVCALCGVTVMDSQAQRVMMREDGGPRWETRHYDRLDCRNRPIRPAEELQAEYEADLAAHRAAVAQRAQEEVARKAKNLARREASAAKKKAAFEAEQERVKDLQEVRRDTEVLFRKNLGTGRGHAELRKHIVHLSDGTTTVRWSAVWSEGSVEDARESLVRATYSDLKWEPDSAPRPLPRLITPPAAGATTARACPPGKHCDNCGSAEPEDGSWMSASLGLACGVGCFDAMSDAEGRHARRYHR